MKFKKHLPTIARILMIAIVVVGVFTHTAHALSNPLDLIGAGFFSIVNGILGSLAYFALMTAGWILSLSGMLLNVGMYLTTHLDLFINQTPVIYTVWAVIRDLSSLILIFFILYAAIRMIIGVEDANFGTLIKNIIIVGVLINFSFFFTRVAIDASNIVSLQFYNAIAPNTVSIDKVSDIPTLVKMLTDKGGVSDALMGSLQITQWWKTNTNGGFTGTFADAGASTINIILIAVGGIIVITIATISFLVAAMAAIVRLAVLIFLLAFSPLWIISWALPKLKDLTSKWTSQLKAQLLFMPVYLGFLYVALRIVTELHLNQLTTGGGAATQGLGNVINLFVGFTIVIVLLNIPFFAAVQVAGSGMEWTDKFFSGARGWVKGKTVGWAATNTVGRAGMAADKYLAKTKFGNSLLGRDIRSSTTGLAANTKFFGATRSRADTYKESTDVAKQSKAITRLDNLKALIASGSTNTALYKAELDKMSEKEKLALGPKILTDIQVVKHLEKDDFAAIKKSDDLELTDDVKNKIKEKRKEALQHALGRGEVPVLKHMIENMDGKDLMKLAPTVTAPGILTDRGIVEHLKESQLKNMKEEGLDPGVRHQIGNVIRATAGTHKAFGYVARYPGDW